MYFFISIDNSVLPLPICYTSVYPPVIVTYYSAYNLYDTLSSRDDSDNVLTIICDILIKQQDNRLKKLGNKMKKELNEATGSK